jgi:protein N-terminal amidase
LQHISPYLEPTTAGITSLWARTTALKYDCIVTVGYPEKVDVSPKWPASPEYYNSAITVNREGETIANYRKSFLYYTDETWALEGPDGFFDGHIEGLGNVAMGICKLQTESFEREYIACSMQQNIANKKPFRHGPEVGPRSWNLTCRKANRSQSLQVRSTLGRVGIRLSHPSQRS